MRRREFAAGRRRVGNPVGKRMANNFTSSVPEPSLRCRSLDAIPMAAGSISTSPDSVRRSWVFMWKVAGRRREIGPRLASRCAPREGARPSR